MSAMDMSDRVSIRGFVLDLLERRGAQGPIGDADPLLSSGLLDSVDVLEITTFLEERWGIDFADRDFDAGDFDTIDSIVAQLAEERD